MIVQFPVSSQNITENWKLGSGNWPRSRRLLASVSNGCDRHLPVPHLFVIAL